MRKVVDINDGIITKLKILAAIEDISVKALIEKSVEWFIKHKEKERLDSMTDEEKEDLGLLLLMQQVDKNDTVSKKEFLKSLYE